MLNFDILKKTKLIETKESFPNNANYPTITKTYECFCKEGEIVEENTPGFNDRFIQLKCKRCLEKYRDYIDYSGSDWKVYLREK